LTAHDIADKCFAEIESQKQNSCNGDKATTYEYYGSSWFLTQTGYLVRTYKGVEKSRVKVL
jgi:hypothetical protein